MSLDLSDPNHERTLRETIAIVRDMRPEQLADWRAKLKRDAALSDDAVLVCECVDAVVNPVLSADLIRQLVERIDANVVVNVVVEVRDAVIGVDINDGTYTALYGLHVDEAPKVIQRLMDLDQRASLNAARRVLQGLE